MVAPWHEAPHLLEEIYTFADALVVGTLLITLLRHADRVKIACVAQLVNVLAPIMTENGGKAWCQTIFWPFYQASRFGRGTVLDCRISSPEYASGKYGEVPYLEAVLVLADDGCLTLFAVNRSASEDLEVEIKLAGLTATRIIDYSAFRSDNPDAVNSSAKPETVIPRLEEGKASIEDGQVSLLLAPLSWNVVRISTGI
jgi:alpha-N-arabinofuranosidase